MTKSDSREPCDRRPP